MENTLGSLLDQGFIINLKKSEDTDTYQEPGPYRAHLNRYPWKPHHWEIIGSGPTTQDAINDLLGVTGEDLAKIGTPYFAEDYVPRTVEEAMLYWDVRLDPEDRMDVANHALDEGFYYGLSSMGVRNAWNLWGTNDDLPKDLHNYFVGLGVGNPGVVGDDISQLLSTAYWHHIHQVPFDMEEAVSRLRDYYKERR